MLYWRKNATRISCYLRQSYHLLCLKIPSSISYLAKFIYKQWGDYQKKVDQDSLTSVIHFFKVVILSVIPQSEQKKTTKYKQRYQAFLIALSIYYQVIVFIYSPTRMRVFEKPKTFLILTPKPENGSFLFRGSLNRCFLKMNDRRATFSFLHLVSVKSYSVFVSDNC